MLYALHSVMCLSLYIYVYCTTRSSCVFSTSENPPSSRLRCALRYRELFWRERGDVSPRKRIGCLGQLCGNLALKLFYKHISPLPVLGVVLDAHLNFVHLTRIHPLCLSVDHEDGDATHTDQQPRYLETHRSYNYEDEPVRLFFFFSLLRFFFFLIEIEKKKKEQTAAGAPIRLKTASALPLCLHYFGGIETFSVTSAWVQTNRKEKRKERKKIEER